MAIASRKQSTNGARSRSTNGAASARRRASDSGIGHSKPTKGSYDTFKEFEGQRYTGMKIGRGHKWRYDEGDWIEKKITPDKWEIRFTTVKRRRGHAPEGSGVPVGTEYHWYVLADQTARKLDANNYATDMIGYKFKLAHKRADKETWSASDEARRRRLVKILKQMAADLEQQGASERPARAAVKKRAAKATPKRRTANARHLSAA
jgi:hypothetical protein